LESDASKKIVDDDYNQGLDLGLNSTPTFYVNGKKIQNPDSVDAFKTIIESELKANNN
jgi:protein-disulfide isomerase